jgi:acyl-coenzyme A thioesterase PaaI-like protein
MAYSQSMTPKTLTDAEDETFRSIPWCAALLEDPTFEIATNIFREPIPNSTQMSLLNRTMMTSDTIAAWCTMRRLPEHSPTKASDVSRTLFSLGSGLDGTPRMLHGGMSSILFDSAMTLLTGWCRESQGLSGYNVTKELKLEFIAPCLTPGVVLIESRVVSISKNRKYIVKGEMKDSQGKVLAKAEGLIVGISKPPNL